jgi:hypothetical protein
MISIVINAEEKFPEQGPVILQKDSNNAAGGPSGGAGPLSGIFSLISF